MQAALSDEPMNSAAARIMAAMAVDDEHAPDELHRVLRRLWIEHLELQAKELASRAGELEALGRLKQVRAQIRALHARL